ncbi:MAG: Thiamine-monophosphate kinase [Betaproteobacteria bacterium]|nr:Thiamine-monophosphate kinase [Betaproteobacteria bacterium]
MATSEFDLIKRYFTHRGRHTVLGVGDDAALVKVRRGHDLLISADMLVAGRHFFRDADPRMLGHKALAVNISDMAAMGATPRWATLGIALPAADTRWVQAFSRGFMALARRFDVDLIGGDTTRGPLNICVQIMGEAPHGLALCRDGARAGDDIWVSGTLGDAALGLAALKRRITLKPAERAHCAARLHTPTPRVALGLAIRQIAHSAIDISDGLLADLGHILERSNVAAEIELSELPTSNVLKRYLDRVVACGALLAGGDDYELCFTAPRSARARIERAGRSTRTRLTCIGAVKTYRKGEPRLIVRAPDGAALRVVRGGYDHFR